VVVEEDHDDRESDGKGNAWYSNPVSRLPHSIAFAEMY